MTPIYWFLLGFLILAVGIVIGWLVRGEPVANALADDVRHRARATKATLDQHAKQRTDEGGAP
jgi:hypothetical protein